MDTQPIVYLYGFKPESQQTLDPTPLARFIMGLDVQWDEALALAIRGEFDAQERYRVTMLTAIQACCGDLLREACQHVAAIEHPVTTVHAAFWRGYALGKYEAFSTAAGALSEIPIAAALAMGEGEP